MVQLIADKKLAEQIMGLTEPCDLCDERGVKLATLTPQSTSRRADIPYSDEEIEAARKGKTVSTQHVLQRLKEGERPDYSKLVVPFTEEEIQAARKKPGRPITELLDRMRAARDES